MGAWSVDDKSSDTLVVVPGEGFWTGSSTLPHLHQLPSGVPWAGVPGPVRLVRPAPGWRSTARSAGRLRIPRIRGRVELPERRRRQELAQQLRELLALP